VLAEFVFVLAVGGLIDRVDVECLVWSQCWERAEVVEVAR
jgi:hypothetical protein